MPPPDSSRLPATSRRKEMPIIAGCPGCSIPIRHAPGATFPDASVWCVQCGGTAPIVQPCEPGAAMAYADAAWVAKEYDR